MNKHEMKLQPLYYDYMLNGTKKVEIRLNDEKRRLINVGDIITFFKEPDLQESFDTKVINLVKYASFEEMFQNFDIDVLADKSMTKEQLLNTLETFYSKQMQDKYGVLGIVIEVL